MGILPYVRWVFEGNFKFIAKNIALIYFKLDQKHSSKFMLSNPTGQTYPLSLVSLREMQRLTFLTTGIIDTLIYQDLNQMSFDDIVDAYDLSVSHKLSIKPRHSRNVQLMVPIECNVNYTYPADPNLIEPLVLFAMQIIAIILCIDTKTHPTEILRILTSQTRVIQNTIIKVFDNSDNLYLWHKELDKTIELFLKHPKFEVLRRKLQLP